jgi:hypothetical protein
MVEIYTIAAEGGGDCWRRRFGGRVGGERYYPIWKVIGNKG